MAKYVSLAMAALLVWLDQAVKAWALTGLYSRITVIPGLFYLSYVENRGAAFGIFQGKTTVLAVISLIVMTVLLIGLLSGRIKDKLLIWSISLIIAGGVGNCIDRLGRGFVVDYLDFSALFGFPVFNLADCCVVVGTGLIMLHILFFENRKTPAKAGKPEGQDDGDADAEQEEKA